MDSGVSDAHVVVDVGVDARDSTIPDAVVCDADHDSHLSLACGGDDCDDHDANRYPGNLEVCDSHDEDCNPNTFGTLDGDGDGYISAMCCNGTVCGNDCNDMNPSVHPTEAESCDRLDNDCDGAIDESLVTVGYYPDCDSDGYGDASATPIAVCGPPSGVAMCTN